ncbi:uncharacterized protein LOC143446525 [Clavelina lepadiformis]|uniref:uncharacterized protein LOC143446525 n=1 Tax=Clavelina lepadiformis TaxID=159417 RepID=UPI004042B387
MKLQFVREMARKVPRLLLFDIDGTLATSRHAKTQGGASLTTALSSAFEKPIERNGVVFSGGTDPSITADLLQANGVMKYEWKDYDERIEKAFTILPQIVEKGVAEGSYQWAVLPNVKELLEKLSKRNDVRVALLTGNLQSTAVLKLKSAGVNLDLFHVENFGIMGAFGSDHGVRSKLVEIAKERYCKHLGVPDIEPNDMVVIGDSPKDISCAHDNGVPCVAVTTGIYSSKDLEDADYVLDGFNNLDESVEAIVETCRA